MVFIDKNTNMIYLGSLDNHNEMKLLGNLNENNYSNELDKYETSSSNYICSNNQISYNNLTSLFSISDYCISGRLENLTVEIYESYGYNANALQTNNGVIIK